LHFRVFQNFDREDLWPLRDTRPMKLTDRARRSSWVGLSQQEILGIIMGGRKYSVSMWKFFSRCIDLDSGIDHVVSHIEVLDSLA